jgi:hypothetical protein
MTRNWRGTGENLLVQRGNNWSLYVHTMQKERPSTGGLIDLALIIWDLPIRPILAGDRLCDLAPIQFPADWVDLDLDHSRARDSWLGNRYL